MSSQMKSGRETSLSNELHELKSQLQNLDCIKKKIELLSEYKVTQEFFSKNPKVESLFSLCTDYEKFVLCSILALGQGEKVFQKEGKISEESVRALLKKLLLVEEFYQELGGIIGYHLSCLDLLSQKGKRQKKGVYHAPHALDIVEDNDLSRNGVVAGIEHLGQLAEIYPLGGAADRLSLNKEEAGAFQIAATLEFCGKSLLEGLIEDLQAREFLHFKLFHKQVYVPLVLMTSDEKGGSSQIRKVFKEKRWFGRREEDFFLFSQPLVPTMHTDGQWCSTGPGQLLFKPGGHGAIWKLAKESGALGWLKGKNLRKAFVRQINNPIAGVDYGLLAFLGIGFMQDKEFGFAACPCAEGVSEGVNVVIEIGEGSCLTNIEYCDFDDTLAAKNREKLLANTNLLFVDLSTIEELLDICPIPGMLVNAKKMKYNDSSGVMQEEEILRLESTMQNLADVLIEPGPITEERKRSFITCNKRVKTISSIKKEFAFGSSMLQTPEQCYLDQLQNARDLLVNYCSFQVPIVPDPMNFFHNGPSFIFLYHPALGPLYKIIQHKLVGGRLAIGSELKLQIADLYAKQIDVDGSLQIITDAIMGHHDENGVLSYSNQTGKCTLKNVRVRNSGINRKASRSFWKEEIVHREKCVIFIEEGGEFYAEDICLRGNLEICVPAGMKVVASMVEGSLQLSYEALSESSWHWDYTINPRTYSIEIWRNEKKRMRISSASEFS